MSNLWISLRGKPDEKIFQKILWLLSKLRPSIFTSEIRVCFLGPGDMTYRELLVSAVSSVKIMVVVVAAVKGGEGRKNGNMHEEKREESGIK